MSALLNLAGLNQFYGESHTLWDIDLAVEQGECVVVMGRNGVGKTTLLRSIMGSLASSGTIEFDKQRLDGKPTEVRAARGIGYVPQGREIFAQLTVEENLRTAGWARPEAKKKGFDHLFAMFPVLKSMLRRRGGDLSGGQQQQLAIARALALDPKLLILDEPTEGIQPNIVAEIGDIVQRLQKEHGLTVLLVEQKLPFARKLGQRFCILDRGRVAATGPMTGLSDEIVNAYLKV
jgi:urea transport system ATP-binding protein